VPKPFSRFAVFRRDRIFALSLVEQLDHLQPVDLVAKSVGE
jgi:hypothetical protein